MISFFTDTGWLLGVTSDGRAGGSMSVCADDAISKQVCRKRMRPPLLAGQGGISDFGRVLKMALCYPCISGGFPRAGNSRQDCAT